MAQVANDGDRKSKRLCGHHTYQTSKTFIIPDRSPGMALRWPSSAPRWQNGPIGKKFYLLMAKGFTSIHENKILDMEA